MLALCLALSVLAVLVVLVPRRKHSASNAGFARRRPPPLPHRDSSRGFPLPKPDWVRRAVLDLHERHPESHRQLAHRFNRQYAARTGMRVGRTWVRELLQQHAYRALHRQRTLKHRVPPELPRNHCWGFDTTLLHVGDSAHTLAGLLDHGTRLNLTLRPLTRFNHWTLLGLLFLAIGRYGKPAAIRLDNHPVHRAHRVRRLLHWAGVRLQFTQIASPWQNGRIERFFGTCKPYLRALAIHDDAELCARLRQFRHYYNRERPHQHLHGRTPLEAWHGIDPFRYRPPRRSWQETWRDWV